MIYDFCFSVWLTSLNLIISRSTMLDLQMTLFHSFLWLSSITLYIYIYIYTHTHTHIHTHICVYTHIHMHTHIYTHADHIFFIHSSIDGHLGYFHVMAIVNSAITTTGVHSSFWMRVFSRYMPRNGIAKSYGSSIVVFKGASMLFSIMAAPIYIPTNSGGGFPFLYTLSSL